MNTRAITQNKKVVTFGEVMLRLTAPKFQRFSQTNEFIATYGGSEANVAISLVNSYPSVCVRLQNFSRSKQNIQIDYITKFLFCHIKINLICNIFVKNIICCQSVAVFIFFNGNLF